MSAGSVSSFQPIIEIRGKSKLTCDLKRHLSPKTVSSILRSLPLEGNAHFLGQNIVYFETMINSGVERQRKEFKKGDIAFSPAGGSICFFLSDVILTKSMTPIGKITSDVGMLSDVKSGDVIAVSQAVS
ncbi:cyclophilin-like fold protein [Candidatus Nitrosotenuis chungbukensis]|uniref:cyclophilin-like fold protein n=1 Tax=Candidatus Nitrosotenuis chungbukensis TaxID=1353246 RepID=UPI0026726D21|nr:cyclophilin-like fold protein [Candidatus Nitrosotenuis chungbukensis]WKT57594.1 cyclophilin-like fold protein [Candidatus Nitrosotenuis chungbukensis]